MSTPWQIKLGACLVAAGGASRLLDGDLPYALLAVAVLIFGWKLVRAERRIEQLSGALRSGAELADTFREQHNEMVVMMQERDSMVAYYRRQLDEAQATVGKANLILRGQR
jgi:hypothetical protein